MSENGNFVVEVDSLWRIYKTGSEEVPALRGLNLRIPPGIFVALKGRSGSGKTTLLNCLSGLDEPTSGKVSVLGRDVFKMTESDRTRWRSQEMGLVFQSFGLIPTLSAYENIDLMLRLVGMHARERGKRTREMLALVGLQKWADHRPYEMSGGQQQRVAVARAIANQPKLILADEPTGELDTTTARDILSLFRKIVDEQKVSFLMTSHDPVVDAYVDTVLSLKDGALVDPVN
jgi:putative ABC transport system ATP-binding protein